jgi:hypothetical protein
MAMEANMASGGIRMKLNPLSSRALTRLRSPARWV